jgi:hypothetical protein
VTPKILPFRSTDGEDARIWISPSTGQAISYGNTNTPAPDMDPSTKQRFANAGSSVGSDREPVGGKVNPQPNPPSEPKLPGPGSPLVKNPTPPVDIGRPGLGRPGGPTPPIGGQPGVGRPPFPQPPASPDVTQNPSNNTPTARPSSSDAGPSKMTIGIVLIVVSLLLLAASGVLFMVSSKSSR